MARRGEFDEDEGFLDSILKRTGQVPMPPSMVKMLMMVAGFAVLATVIAITWAVWPSGSSEEETSLPVMRSDETAYKIAPEEPGGMMVPNRDSTIFDTLSKEEGKEKEVENLFDDAEKPVNRDEALGKPAPAEKETKDPATPVAEKTTDEKVTEEKTATAEEKPVTAEKEKSADTVAVPEDESKTATKEEAGSPPSSSQLSSVSGPAPKIVEDPAPAEVKTEEPAVSPVKPEKTEEEAPVATTGGSSFVQFAAVKSEADAKAKWSKLQSSYSFLSGLALHVQKADLGAKGTFYRVQAGPMPLTDAQDVCGKVKAAKGDCLVVK